MASWLLLAIVYAVQDSSTAHVRTTEPRIQALIDEGIARSETFRRLVTTLDASDVFVYVEPKLTRGALGGFLAHDLAGRGGWRYVRVSADFHGSHRRLVALLAHELQHAVEIAQAPEVRDAKTLQDEFRRRAIKFGCGGECYETQAAKDIESIVNVELGQPQSAGNPARRENQIAEPPG
jgi:hypothetical protein